MEMGMEGDFALGNGSTNAVCKLCLAEMYT